MGFNTPWLLGLWDYRGKSPSRDSYGKHEVAARRPMLLDSVMEGREPSTDSLLLRMPSHILAEVLDLLADDKRSLASLALVNSDCRQLARCSQFAEIHFDYSAHSRRLIWRISEEAEGRKSRSRRRRRNLTQQPLTIGACVRKIKFHSDPRQVGARHPHLYQALCGKNKPSFPHLKRSEYAAEADEYYLRLRDRAVQAIRLAMPNLQVLIWEDGGFVDSMFLHEIMRSSMPHVKLGWIGVDQEWRLQPPTPVNWPVRSLDLDLRIEEPGESIGDFCQSLFQSCAPSLESLYWHEFAWTGGAMPDSDVAPLSFPRLRHLRLEYSGLDLTICKSFLAAPLRSLEFSCYSADHLSTCQPIKTLESLVVRRLNDYFKTSSQVAKFIRKHKHIEKLSVHDCVATKDQYSSVLDNHIIPVLAEGGFSNLRSLCLWWGRGYWSDQSSSINVDIPDSALETIGTIATLQSLSLCAGRRADRPNQWLINHRKLRGHLSSLGNLKLLALVGDVYPLPENSNGEPDHYYTEQRVGEQERIDAESRPDLDMDESLKEDGEVSPDMIWEKAHRNRMLEHAEAYATVLPALEWILCGQRPIALRRDLQDTDGPKKAVPLTNQRDTCETFLECTFGIEKEITRNF